MLDDMTATIRLGSGVEMPRLGLGTYKSAEGGDVERSVAAARPDVVKIAVTARRSASLSSGRQMSKISTTRLPRNL